MQRAGKKGLQRGMKAVCFLAMPPLSDTTLASAPAAPPSPRWLFPVFCLSLLAILLLHVASMRVFPLPWLDEVHIVEMGRAVWAGGQPSTSFMTTPDGRCYLPFYYLGPGLQELAFRIGGPCGPRLSAMLGLLAAGWLCRLWLLARGMRPSLAAAAGLLVAMNPLLTMSVHLVRVDGWAFAVLFLSLLALARGVARPPPQRRRNLLIAGALAGANVFVWPSAVLFAPFLLVEFLHLGGEARLSARERWSLAGVAAAGAALAGLLLAAPWVHRVPDLLAGVRLYTTSMGIAPGQLSLVSAARSVFTCAVKEFLRDPLLLSCMAGGVLLAGRPRWLTMGFFVSALLCVATSFHTGRIIYLLPFAWLLAIAALERVRKWRLAGYTTLLAGLLAYAALTSVLAYAGMSLIYRDRSLEALTAQLRQQVGGAGTRVYSRTLQDYYSGRLLGWQHYRYSNDQLVLQDARWARLLAGVDYVVVPRLPDLYAVEESYTLYGILRDYLICCARAAGSRPATGAAALGRALAFSAPPREEEAAFEAQLAEMGFRRAGTIDLSTAIDSAPWPARWVLRRLGTPPGFDPLTIWRREHPGQPPPREPQAGRQTEGVAEPVLTQP
jgi:hypothetical protein